MKDDYISVSPEFNTSMPSDNELRIDGFFSIEKETMINKAIESPSNNSCLLNKDNELETSTILHIEQEGVTNTASQEENRVDSYSMKDINTEMTHILSSCSLKDILKLYNKLETEIPEADEAIQTLVYKNYSQFINAALSVKTTELECVGIHTPELIHEQLEPIINNATLIYTTMEASVNKIQYNVENRFLEAMNLYLKYQQFLVMYQNKMPFKTIYKESIDLFNEITETVRNELGPKRSSNVYSTVVDPVVAMRLLIKIDENPDILIKIWEEQWYKDLHYQLKNNICNDHVTNLKDIAYNVQFIFVPLLLKTIDNTYDLFEPVLKNEHIILVQAHIVQKSLNIVFESILNMSQLECQDGKSIAVSISTLRASFIPLHKKWKISDEFMHFLKQLAFICIQAKLKLCLKDCILTYLVPLLLESPNPSDLLFSSESNSNQETNRGFDLLGSLLERIGKNTHTITVLIGTALTECDLIITGLFGNETTFLRQKMTLHLQQQFIIMLESFEQLIPLSLDQPFISVYNNSSFDQIYASFHEVYTDMCRIIERPLYTHIRTSTIVLMLYWLKIYGLPKLRDVFNELFFTNDILFNIASISKSYDTVIIDGMQEIACRWGRELGHTYNVPIKMNEPNEPLCPTLIARSLVQHAFYTFYVYEVLFGPDKPIYNKRDHTTLQETYTISINMIHLKYQQYTQPLPTQTQHNSLMDINKLLLRRLPINIFINSIPSWQILSITTIRVLIRVLLDTIRNLSLMSLHQHIIKQIQIDVLYIRDSLKDFILMRDNLHFKEESKYHHFGYILPTRPLQPNSNVLCLVNLYIDDIMAALHQENNTKQLHN